jgi:hypothetical protein
VLAAFSCADACSARSSKVRELGLLCVDHKVLTTVCQLSLRNPGIYDSFSKVQVFTGSRSEGAARTVGEGGLSTA